MIKETKLAKKEANATKKAAKEYNKQTKEYNKLVKKIDKKNAKLEKKASKKGKPFTPIATPTFEEAFAGGGSTGSKAGKIIKMIILIVLLIFVIYFIVMFVKYQAPALTGGNEEETTGEPATYERYKNKHVSTTTPDYPVYEAQKLLKQVIHDNWKTIGFSSDVSGGSINYTSNVENINNADCYIFNAGGKKFAVSEKLQAVYVYENGTYKPITFNNTNYLFN